MIAEKSRTNVYLDVKLKEQAKSIYKEYGLSLSEAVNIFLAQSVFNRGLPFEVKIPNDRTIQALDELDNKEGKHFKTVDELFNDLDT